MTREASSLPAALFEWLSRFEDDPAIVYALDSDLKIAWCNAASDRFALGNGDPQLLRPHEIGRSVVDVTPEPLRPFYAKLYSDALYEGKEMGCLYECSSGDRFRRFHMHVMRKIVRNQEAFLVVVNSPVLEESRQSPVTAFDPAAFRESNGLITMCSHCRRTRMPDAHERWVWVPDLVRNMPREVSHGLCRLCFDIHYLR